MVDFMNLCRFIGYLLSEGTTVTVAFNLSAIPYASARTRTGVLLGSEKKSSIRFCVKENHFLLNGQPDAKLKLAFLRQSLVRISLRVSLGGCSHFSVQERHEQCDHVLCSSSLGRGFPIHEGSGDSTS